MNMKTKVTVENGYGIRVMKACMTCAHKDCLRLSKSRMCALHRKRVSRYGLCDQWKMNPQMKAAGSGEGRVKRVEYLRYVMRVRQQESMARQRGLTVVHRSIETIREMYEKTFGSVYINL